MSEATHRRPASQRARASTATTQNVSGNKWPDEDLKSKHMRNASEISTVTVTLDSAKSFTSETSTATLVDRRRSSSRTMQQEGGGGRRADDPTNSNAPVDAYSLEQLVDRLLQRPTSEGDARYLNTFLCLYRMFAAPSEVITCILQKFEEIGQDTESAFLVRLAKQLRTLTILVHWINEYPGDFAHPATSLHLMTFAKNIASTAEFAFSSRELLLQLENLKPDDDTDWARSDKKRGRASTSASFSSVPSLKISLPTVPGETTMSPSQESIVSSVASTDDLIRAGASTSSLKKPGSRHSETSSVTSSLMEPPPPVSSANPISPYEIAQRHANMILRPTRSILTKDHYHDFMNFDDDVIAKELTRIDWIMFSAVRPRDLIRHINTTENERGNHRNLAHIDRMIEHFNHVAAWVAEIVLIRNKPKQRGKMLEKCMSIAWKLRQMNNYNGVGAFVAGISNVAISRLRDTHLMVDQNISRNYMRLGILMGNTNGNFAYRLGWNNTTAEKIPFLPLHRHDLVLAQEANHTFANKGETLINWTKFEIMGKTLWDIQKAQRMSYPGLQRNPEVQRLIMEGYVGDDIDDVLWERSIEVERSTGSEQRRRNNWLR